MTRKLRISAPADMLKNIANMYQSTTRVLMEYIDNSLDGAEEMRRENDGRYPYQ